MPIITISCHVFAVTSISSNIMRAKKSDVTKWNSDTSPFISSSLAARYWCTPEYKLSSAFSIICSLTRCVAITFLISPSDCIHASLWKPNALFMFFWVSIPQLFSSILSRPTTYSIPLQSSIIFYDVFHYRSSSYFLFSYMVFEGALQHNSFYRYLYCFCACSQI